MSEMCKLRNVGTTEISQRHPLLAGSQEVCIRSNKHANSNHGTVCRHCTPGILVKVYIRSALDPSSQCAMMECQGSKEGTTKEKKRKTQEEDEEGREDV
jgi:hypothetical protein